MPSEGDVDWFDYLMSTRSSYLELDKAIGFLERSMKRERHTLSQALGERHGKRKRWVATANNAIKLARADLAKHFPDLTMVSPNGVREVMNTTMDHRDRWD